MFENLRPDPHFAHLVRRVGLQQTIPKPGAVPSVAVLPFLNLPGNPEKEYFSNGLTDELTSTLAKLNGLRVVARTSALKFKGKGQDVRDVGKQLNATAVLEGSVQWHRDRVLIAVQLNRTSDGYHLWAGTYERNAQDILGMEDEITRTIAGALQVELAEAARPGAKPRPVEAEAHDLYLRGRYWWNRRTAPALWRSIQYFNQALEKDPLYAKAYLGLADAYYVLGSNDQGPPSEVLPKARAAARQALQLDETLSEAHATLAAVTYAYDWDVKTAEAEFRRAIELNPSCSTAHQWYGLLLLFGRRFEEAASEFRRAQDLDPLSLMIALDAGQVYYYSGNYDATVELVRRTLAQDPDFSAAHDLLGMAYLQKGQYKLAIAEFQRFLVLSGRDPDALMRLGESYAASGERDKALEMIEELKKPANGRYSPPYNIAVVYARLGAREQALEWLKTAIQQRSPSCTLLGIDPAFATFHSDPRFQELARNTGFSKS